MTSLCETSSAFFLSLSIDTYLRPEPLPDRIFRARLRVIEGDRWTPELADQNTLRFQHRARDYRERINLIMRRSDLREPFEGSEILALDGNEEPGDLTLHFALYFDPYAELVSAADLRSILLEEITGQERKYFRNLTIDPNSLVIKEVSGTGDDVVGTSSSPLGGKDEVTVEIVTTARPPRKCEPLRLGYCRSVGYNVTTYPNFFGHGSLEEVEADLISFRELVDAECFRQAFDFICRLLQPPCEYRSIEEPTPGTVCRQYCQAFWSGCGERLPERLRRYLDCERFPESTGVQSCHSKPGCTGELQANAMSSRLCDGVADCADLSDENTCTFCAYGAISCGRSRACYARNARCDGKLDCPDGSDEKDCLSISPQVSFLTFPPPIVPFRPRFYSEGYAVFSEKGTTGKLCSVGMEGNEYVRNTVAESLCKALGYERVDYSEIRNDTEPNTSYVRVLDPRASEISFVRTQCQSKQSLYVACSHLECGVQSTLPATQSIGLSKMATPGDWPWHVALLRADTHVCDGTLVSKDWVLTTESCFQGQAKATWMAVFGAVRLSSNAPWTQRRRIIGMVKSPVEGSTAAMVRLETPVVYSDFVRPICLPDIPLKETIDRSDNNVTPTPHAEKYSTSKGGKLSGRKLKEYRQYFEMPGDDELVTDEYGDLNEAAKYVNQYSADFTDEQYHIPKAEAAVAGTHGRTTVSSVPGSVSAGPAAYPLPANSPQTNNYISALNYISSGGVANVGTGGVGFQQPTKLGKQSQWTNCNTLGWSRQRDHLQRVQLKLIDMSPCENISIATVNSMCAESAYHKQDCSEEEFAGSPVICLLPSDRRWALVGISSWRIACAPNGIERPRMYDKIIPNTPWIRDTITATVT
uniref:Atrial natriuretic peptide-converting enzyme n=1 Tax=Anopheles maculatus TaxID=74869 RepID=A0A182S918_9DIPT